MNFQRSTINYRIGEKISPINWTKQRVEDYALQVAALGGFDVGGDLQELVETFGGRIEYEPIDEWLKESGSIFVHDAHDFDIVLPLYTSPRRDRFTIAHELGHFFLHAKQGTVPIIATRSGSTRIEWEANWFAASLLMPREDFLSDCKKNTTDVVLAERYGVSTDAIRVRRESLGA